jgi:hypothetical protein
MPDPSESNSDHSVGRLTAVSSRGPTGLDAVDSPPVTATQKTLHAERFEPARIPCDRVLQDLLEHDHGRAHGSSSEAGYDLVAAGDVGDTQLAMAVAV